MSDTSSPPRRRRSYDRDELEPGRDHSRERKRQRSRSPGTDHKERQKKRYRSSSGDRYRRSDRDRHRSKEDAKRRRRDEEDDRNDHHRRKRRSRSPDHTRQRRRRRSSSLEPSNRSNRHEEDKRLTHTRSRRYSSRERHRHSSRERHSHRRTSFSVSPPARSRRKASSSPSAPRRSRAPLPSQQDAFTSKHNSRSNNSTAVGLPTEKQKPNYSTSGKLAAETNTVSIGGEAIILKYHEPPEARKPPTSQAWRMYEFKGDNADPISTTELGSRSCWLFGREKAVVDFLIEHPSCSKQHAVIQFRYHEKKSEFGDKVGMVKPYVLDLESANGVLVNGSRIPDRRYIELKSGDAVGFGESTREYIVLLPPKEKE